MAIESVFITGSNRGIGLELTRQFLNSPTPPQTLIAGCRDPDKAQELQQLKAQTTKTAVHLVKLDVSSEDDIKSAATQVCGILGDKGLTLLINNAGIMGITPFPGTSAKTYMEHFQINTIAPILLSDYLLPLLKKAAAKHPEKGLSSCRAAIVNITGLIAAFHAVDYNIGRDIEAYRISKTALNNATAIIQRNLKESGILVVAIHPGWVETDMGGKGADLTVTESITHVMKTIQDMNESQGGKMLNYDGKILDW